MKIFIILFGLFIIAMAGLMLLRAKFFTETMIKHAESAWMHILAASVRIVFGLVLVLYADQSRFPLTLHIIGWIGIVAGVLLALLPRAKFARLINWALKQFTRYIPVGALFAIIFGGFLIYAVV